MVPKNLLPLSIPFHPCDRSLSLSLGPHSTNVPSPSPPAHCGCYYVHSVHSLRPLLYFVTMGNPFIQYGGVDRHRYPISTTRLSPSPGFALVLSYVASCPLEGICSSLNGPGGGQQVNLLSRHHNTFWCWEPL